MLGFGHGPELIILLAIALIVFGPGKIPEVAQMLGKGIRELRKASSELQQTFDMNALMNPPEPVQAEAPEAAPPAEAPVEHTIMPPSPEPEHAAVTVEAFAPAPTETAPVKPKRTRKRAPAADVAAAATVNPEAVATLDSAPTANEEAGATHDTAPTVNPEAGATLAASSTANPDPVATLNTAPIGNPEAVATLDKAPTANPEPVATPEADPAVADSAPPGQNPNGVAGINAEPVVADSGYANEPAMAQSEEAPAKRRASRRSTRQPQDGAEPSLDVAATGAEAPSATLGADITATEPAFAASAGAGRAARKPASRRTSARGERVARVDVAPPDASDSVNELAATATAAAETNGASAHAANGTSVELEDFLPVSAAPIATERRPVARRARRKSIEPVTADTSA